MGKGTQVGQRPPNNQSGQIFAENFPRRIAATFQHTFRHIERSGTSSDNGGGTGQLHPLSAGKIAFGETRTDGLLAGVRQEQRHLRNGGKTTAGTCLPVQTGIFLRPKIDFSYNTGSFAQGWRKVKFLCVKIHHVAKTLLR